jgi:glycosyltransferase involved in cell wall biosynthesis
MKYYPKTSIITPSFNQGHYIEQTIISVLDQNYPNLEYIIIDGGSTDNTVDIIKKYEKHLKYWVSEPDRGQCHAINKGLKHCTGDIFNWLNSDDYYEPLALHKIVEAFMYDSSIQAVGGRERSFLSDTNETVEIYEGTKIDGDLYDLIYQGIIVQPATFWKLDVIRKLGPLPESLHYTMDSYWWTKYLLLDGIDQVNLIQDVLTNFRLHANSKSVSSQDKFESNRFAIRLAIAKSLNLNPSIIEYFKRKTDINIPVFIDPEELNKKLSTERLEANFAMHVYPLYYMSKEYQATNQAFDSAFKYYKTWKTIIDFIKLKLLPITILNRLRD